MESDTHSIDTEMSNQALRIERMSEQIRVMETLINSITGDDAFTDTERHSLAQKMRTLKQTCDTARSQLKRKISLYEENVQKTGNILRRRQNKLDDVMSGQDEIIIGEIMELFVPHHQALLSNCEKSITLIREN